MKIPVIIYVFEYKARVASAIAVPLPTKTVGLSLVPTHFVRLCSFTNYYYDATLTSTIVIVLLFEPRPWAAA